MYDGIAQLCVKCKMCSSGLDPEVSVLDLLAFNQFVNPVPVFNLFEILARSS